jgi:hypothetical protein
METLAERLAHPDVASLPDWAAASALNQPDATIPAVVEWRQTQIGIGSILDALGPEAGAALLDVLTTLAISQPVIRWGLRLIEDGRFDLSRPSARDQLARLVGAGVVLQAEADALLALSRVERHPSWAEAHGVAVDARAVGLARGGR